MPLSFSLNFKHAALYISFQFFERLCFKRKPFKMFFVMLLFLEQFQSAANRKRQTIRLATMQCRHFQHDDMNDLNLGLASPLAQGASPLTYTQLAPTLLGATQVFIEKPSH